MFFYFILCCLHFLLISPSLDWFSSGVMLKVLLDIALLNALLIQILNELLALHPVDERTDVAAVSEEGSARQVYRTSCGRQETGHEATSA